MKNWKRLIRAITSRDGEGAETLHRSLSDQNRRDTAANEGIPECRFPPVEPRFGVSWSADVDAPKETA